MICRELECVWRCIYKEDESVTIFLPELDELTRFPATEISDDAMDDSEETIPSILSQSHLIDNS